MPLSPVWDAQRCHFFPPWGSFCSVLPDQPKCRTFRHLPRRTCIPTESTRLQLNEDLKHQPNKILLGDVYLTWKRIITWVTLVLRSRLSCFSSLVRTDRTKSPGLLWLSRTRKLPALPFSVRSFSASRPERCPWYHLEIDKEECSWTIAKQKLEH